MSKWKEIESKLFIQPWPYLAGAVLLALLNIGLLLVAGRPWQITTGFTYWGAWLWQLVGGAPQSWPYFADNPQRIFALTSENVFTNHLSLMNVGIILGALIAILLSSQFKLKFLKSKKQLAFALGGGIIMGYGTRIALGCNIGALFSSIPSLSLSGWIYGLFAFLGAWVGGKFLVKYML